MEHSRCLFRSAGAFGLLFLFAIASACGGSQGTSSTSSPVLRSIQVTGASANLVAGQTQQMTATGIYSSGPNQDVTSSVKWSSSNTAIATVAPGGMVTAKASGACTISATLGAVNGSSNLSVAPALVSIAITPAQASLAPGTTQQFLATGTYSDGSTQDITSSASWSSGNTAVATVSSTFPTKGLAKAVANGSTTITATSGSISGSATLSVTSATATSISVTPAITSVALGLSQQFVAVATFSDGTTQDITNVATWQSQYSSIASITVSGLATGRNVGSTTISAAFESATGTATLTVNAANLTAISIQPANGSIAQGTQLQFIAMGSFNDGGTRDITHQVTWSSSNPALLSIGAGNGLAFGTGAGNVTVTATLGSVTDSVPFTITNATITSIAITPASKSIPTGAHAHFTATGTFSDASTQDLTTSVSWTSSNTSVATVGSTSGNYGLATGVSPGNANISATFTYGGATANGTVALTVTSATLSSITLTPVNAIIAPASGLQYVAQGTFSDGTVQYMSPYVTWSSSDTSVATVSVAGVATGQSAGTATITAQSGSVSATASLVVESAALASIRVNPAAQNIPATLEVQFTATGTFANGDVLDLTSAVTWTSSASSIATISNAGGSIGVATGLQPGTTTISAVFSGQVGTATLTINNATLNAIAVAPNSASISSGAAQQFSATATFSDASVFNVTNQVAWSSSDVNVATVNSNGLASGVASGTSTIKATMDGLSDAAILTVQ